MKKSLISVAQIELFIRKTAWLIHTKKRHQYQKGSLALLASAYTGAQLHRRPTTRV